MAHEQKMSVISVSPATSELEDESAAAHLGAPTTAGMTGGSAVRVAQLRSRVEQQSSLIAMMKQRSDETFREVYIYIYI